MVQSIQELADNIQRQTRLTAVGVAVGHHDAPIEVAVSGVRRHKHAVPVETTDLWHIGSITKSITATLIAKFVEAGELGYESKLSDLLPDITMHSSWSECSLEHVLTHTAGLPANFRSSAQKIESNTNEALMVARRDLIQEVLEKPVKSACGSRHLYSNVGYTIVGHIAETLTGMFYEELVEERVLVPLGLHSAGFGPPQGLQPDDQPMGHSNVLWYRKSANPFKGIADNNAIVSAAGRAHMNLHDLVSYGRAHLKGELGANSFLKVESWQRLHKPFKENYAFGWVNEDQDWTQGPMIWHNGSNTLWYALLMLFPEKNTVLAFATNTGAVRKADRAFGQAAEKLINDLH